MAGGVSIGPRIQVDGEEEYRKQINGIIEQSKTLDAEMKALTATFGDEDTAQQRAAKSTDLLNAQLEAAKQRTELVRAMTAQATAEYEENSSQVLKWRQALASAKEQQAKLERAVEENTRALEDEGEEAEDAGINLKKLGEETDGASQKTSIFADVLKGNLVSDAIGAAVDGLKRMGEQAIDFGKRVIESYGELEQNLGGSESVFGEYAEKVKEASEMAYSAMGASQSEYLATANKMGALFQGSGVEVERSMELTVQAMQRAADAASVMGIDTSAALEAVTGAAKGNYTMMDNLGVKMDATTLKAYALEKGMESTWEQMSNAEKAELAMQYFFEQTEKYAGNFETEARETISGSIGMLQASVESWIAGLGDSEADIGRLTENVIDSFETVVKNTSAVVENVIKSIPQVYDSIMSSVAEKSPELAQKIENFVTPLKSILTSFKNLGEEIWPLLSPVLDNLAAGFQIIADVVADVAAAAERAVGWLRSASEWLDQTDANWNLNDSSGYYVDDYNPAFAGYNAAGDRNWRGGLTWVGETGPELVQLPRGARIYSNQESSQIAAAAPTDTRRMEQLQSENNQLMRALLNEFAGMHMRGRMLYG